MKKKGEGRRLIGTLGMEVSHDEIGQSWPAAYNVGYLKDSLKNGFDHEDIFLRTPESVSDELDKVIERGKEGHYLPIIAGFGIVWIMKPIIQVMKARVKAAAQSPSAAYYLDILDGKKSVLRIWDVSWLEPGGLEAMASMVDMSVPTLSSPMMTPDTPMKGKDKKALRMQSEIILAYLHRLLTTTDYLREEDFGYHLMTRTSLVRLMAKRKIGVLTYKGRHRKVSLLAAFQKTARQEDATDYRTYALRRASFRGGLAFVCGREVGLDHHDVASLDVTSMHHIFINGRLLPVKFRPVDTDLLHVVWRRVVSTSVERILDTYEKPFDEAFHVAVRLKGLKLKKGSLFDREAFGIIPADKLYRGSELVGAVESDTSIAADKTIFDEGLADSAVGAVCAFGKVLSADEIVLHVSELEAWCLGQVYEWDEEEVLYGELSQKFVVPPDYVTLQSNVLFSQKTDVKAVLTRYEEGVPTENVPDTIPEAMKNGIASGSLDRKVLKSYYKTTIKAAFNGIYGSQSMDPHRPSWAVDGNGQIKIDSGTIPSKENGLSKGTVGSIYTYGLRISGGSRMHLIIALELLDGIVTPLSGDTDSIKCVAECGNDKILDALRPLHDATDRAVARVQERVRALYPDLASDFKGLGHFVIEEADPGEDRCEHQMDGWAKTRITMSHGRYHITAAGLPQPIGMYTIEDWCDEMGKTRPFEKVASFVLGYNTFVVPEIAHGLTAIQPKSELVEEDIPDRDGVTRHVHAPSVVVAEESGITMGDPKYKNVRENIAFLRKIGRYPDVREKMIDVEDGKAVGYFINDDGEVVDL